MASVTYFCTWSDAFTALGQSPFTLDLSPWSRFIKLLVWAKRGDPSSVPCTARLCRSVVEQVRQCVLGSQRWRPSHQRRRILQHVTSLTLQRRRAPEVCLHPRCRGIVSPRRQLGATRPARRCRRTQSRWTALTTAFRPVPRAPGVPWEGSCGFTPFGRASGWLAADSNADDGAFAKRFRQFSNSALAQVQWPRLARTACHC